MQELANLLIELLVYIILGGIIATLEMCFQHYMENGMIFNSYWKWLEKMIVKSKQKRNVSWIYIVPHNGAIKSGYSKKKQWWYIRLITAISNPLGLCCYCNGTWLAIITYLLLFGFSLKVFLLIGTTWFFISLLYKDERSEEI